ncbi:MAG: hypothetical protein A3K68_04020 [Euryarchaeota archaeon RBG_16_68_13]|nr:MAG: hypothetical protein A3K68_04020 [Euryarchaeota archaeon RBG_16_68_13]
MRCTSTPPKETKVCPVCDSTIAADARRCEYCQTDLSLFDVAGGFASDEPTSTGSDSRSIDEILASIAGSPNAHADIFETLKSVGKSETTADDLVVEEQKGAATQGEASSEQFICPVCNASVRADAAVCPGCGAQFVEGEEAEFECPVCKANVAADADTCPSCGVRFAEEGAEAEEPTPTAHPKSPPTSPTRPPRTTAVPPLSGVRITLGDRLAAVREAKREAPAELPIGDRKLMYRELPKLVNDVKALLLTAKRIGMQIEEEKRTINEAIAAGKRRDIERAVHLIDQARHSMDIAFTDVIGGRIEAFAIEVQRAGGPNAANLEKALQDAVNHLETGNYDAAWDVFQNATAGFQTRAKEAHEARSGLERDERLLAQARDLGMKTADLDRLLRQSKESAGRGDPEAPVRISKQIRERMTSDLPAFVQEEMKKARNILLDKKMRGGDLSKSIGILKAASVHMKKEEWSEAIRYLKEFHREIDSF